MASHSQAVSSPPLMINPEHNVLVSIPRRPQGITKHQITFSLSGVRRPHAMPVLQPKLTFLLDGTSDWSKSFKVDPSLFFESPPRTVTVDIHQSCTRSTGKVIDVFMRKVPLDRLTSNPYGEAHLHIDFNPFLMGNNRSISLRPTPITDSHFD